MKTVLEGMEGSYLDPRLPRESKYKRDPKKTYEAFILKIPKITDIKSLKDHDVDPAFISEQMDHARTETEGLRDSLVQISSTFDVVEEKHLVKKAGSVLKLFESKDFGLNEVKTGLIELLQIQGELKLSLEIYGGGQGVQVDNARAAARCFQRLLEVF